MTNNDIKRKAILGRLRGFLKASEVFKNHNYIDDEELWGGFNQSIVELNECSNAKYSQFEIIPRVLTMSAKKEISPALYITRVAGLIGQIEAELNPEREIFPEYGLTTINNNSSNTNQQEQNQVVNIELQVKIEELETKKSKYPAGSQEKKFLEQVIQTGKNMKNISELLTQIPLIATQIGVGLDTAFKLFA